MMPPESKRRRLNGEDDGSSQTRPAEDSHGTASPPGSPTDSKVSLQDTISYAAAPIATLEDPLSGPDTHDSFVPFDGRGSCEPRTLPEPSATRTRAVPQSRDEAQEHAATAQPAKPIQKATVSKEDVELLQELYVADPNVEMQLLEDRKDKFIPEAFDWIVGTEQYQAFVSWEAGQQCRMLWVRGPAGTGKTMLVMGIIKLLRRPLPETPMAHFFCQGTNNLFSTKSCVLRSLLWQLLGQQPHLIHHAKAKFEHSAKPWFAANGEDERNFVALSQVFQAILQDPSLEPCYVVVDALDECKGSTELLTQITDFVALTDKVKWLISSRPEVVYDTGEAHMSHFRVEIDSQVLRDPVQKYIEHKLLTLSSTYNAEVLGEMAKEINARAENTFLWVWFVFQELNSKHKSGRRKVCGNPLDTIKQFPAGLSAVYRRIMDSIEEDDDRVHVDHCRHCLDAVYLAFEPMTTREMAAILFISNEEMDDVILSCGSFLSVSQPGHTIGFIHQSAKDYLDKARLGVDDSSVWTDEDMGRQSMQAMMTPRPGYKALHMNMYNLDHFGPVDKSKLKMCAKQEPLVSLRYVCKYWVYHWLRHGSNVTDLDGTRRSFTTFVPKYFSHWVEAACFLQLDSYYYMLSQLRFCLNDVLPDDLLKDYIYLIEIAEDAPLQVYLQAALFHRQRGNAWAHDTCPIASILGRDNAGRYQHLRIQAEDSGKGCSLLGWPATQWRVTSQSDTLDIWDLETVHITQSFRLDEASDTALGTDLQESIIEADSVFSSTGQWFAASYSSSDRAIKVWNLETGECIARHKEPEYRVTALSSDGKRLAQGKKNVVCISDGAKDTPPTEITTGCEIMHLLFSPHNRWLACRLADGKIELWDVNALELVQTLAGCSDWPHAIFFSADSKFLTARSGYITSVWDIESGEQVQPPLRSSLPFEVVVDGRRVPILERCKIKIHGDLFMELPFFSRVWFPASGNKITIASERTIVTIACECPSCQENFGH